MNILELLKVVKDGDVVIQVAEDGVETRYMYIEKQTPNGDELSYFKHPKTNKLALQNLMLKDWMLSDFGIQEKRYKLKHKYLKHFRYDAYLVFDKVTREYVLSQKQIQDTENVQASFTNDEIEQIKVKWECDLGDWQRIEVLNDV